MATLMAIAVKRAYEAPSPADGRRILVERLWPRGLSKERLALDLWSKDVAPSSELRRWFSHEVAKGPEFRRRYREELGRDPAGSCTPAEARPGRPRHSTWSAPLTQAGLPAGRSTPVSHRRGHHGEIRSNGASNIG